MHSVQKVWTPLHRQLLIPLHIFSKYRPCKIWDKHKNKLIAKSYFSTFSRLQIRVKYFSYKEQFNKQHQAKATRQHLIRIPPPRLLQENLEPLPSSTIFQKSHIKINRGGRGSHYGILKELNVKSEIKTWNQMKKCFHAQLNSVFGRPVSSQRIFSNSMFFYLRILET